jgi:hypothetical protein
MLVAAFSTFWRAPFARASFHLLEAPLQGFQCRGCRARVVRLLSPARHGCRDA